jgi:large subunit ribosomal protein L15
MKLHDLQPTPGSHKPARRVGRGHGSGRGKTAGRGTKGQKARAGGGIPAWFEGGQTPLHVRTPKLHGFTNRFRVEYATINLAQLAEAEKGVLITPQTLEHDQLVRTQKTKPMPLKVLGTGTAPKGVTIHAHAFTRTALEKLAAAGSTAQRISWPENAPVDDETDAAEAAATHARTKAGRAEARAIASGDAPAADAAPDAAPDTGEETPEPTASDAAAPADGEAIEATESESGA